MIMEFRTYMLQPGKTEAFLEFFQNSAVPRMQQIGMTVLGPFGSLVKDREFAYARTFESNDERERLYKVYYESEDWLGWMIDTAMGMEESFVTFYGDTETDAAMSLAGTAVSGIHTSRLTIATILGTITSVTEDALLVTDDEGTKEFRIPAAARVFIVTGAGGMEPAKSGTPADLAAGDKVLVLGSDEGDHLSARQIVKRPA